MKPVQSRRIRKPLVRFLGAVLALGTITACASDSSNDNGAASTTAVITTMPPATPTPTGAVGTTVPGDTVATTAATTTTPPPEATLAPKDIRLALVEIGKVEQPTAFAVRANDTTLFVTSQPGTIHALRPGSNPVVVGDLAERVRSGGEQGLLGLAFRPDGNEAYIFYTDKEGDLQIDAYPVAADGTFDTAAPRPVINIAHPGEANHNGGHLIVDTDGLLYIGTGDGGGSGDPARHALDRTSLLGKILRIDPRADGNAPYRLPEDNPFYGMSSTRNEIWAYGFRNPWRFSFDRITGDFWVGDVGQNEVEEISFVSAADGAGAGGNFGWSAYEGSRRFNDDQSGKDTIKPIHEYRHRGNSASVTGGFVYRGAAIPALYGAYVFGDQAQGSLWALRREDSGKAVVARVGSVDSVSSFGEDHDGELYALSYSRGTVYRIAAAESGEQPG